MPRKYNKRKKGYRKKNSRSGGYSGRKYYVKKYQNSGTLIADTTKVVMKYAEDINVTVDGTLGANYLFRCNSIFDPNQSGVGHQPLGRDQYSTFYQRYVVVGSKITVRFMAYETGSDTNDSEHITNVGVSTINSTGDTIIVPSEFMENNRTTYGVICPQKPTRSITKMFSAKNFFGVKNVIDEEDLGADFETNPVNEALWQLKFWPTISGLSRVVSCNVMIQYICVLRERKNIGGS